MSKVILAGGAEVDLASGEDVAALHDRMSDLDSMLRAGKPAYLKRSSGSAVATSTAVATFVDAGGPPSGKVWDVRSVNVLTAAPYGPALSWPCVVYVVAGNPNPADAVDFGQAVPASWHHGRGEMPVLYPEHLFVGVLVGVNGTQLIATMSCVEYPVAAVRVGNV